MAADVALDARVRGEEAVELAGATAVGARSGEGVNAGEEAERGLGERDVQQEQHDDRGHDGAVLEGLAADAIEEEERRPEGRGRTDDERWQQRGDDGLSIKGRGEAPLRELAVHGKRAVRAGRGGGVGGGEEALNGDGPAEREERDHTHDLQVRDHKLEDRDLKVFGLALALDRGADEEGHQSSGEEGHAE